MSEIEPTMPSSADFQLEVLVADVESRFAAAEYAMAELHSAIVRLRAHQSSAQTPRASLPSGAVTPSPESTEALISSLGGIEATAGEETAVGEVEQGHVEQDEEAKREEVGRMVAEARAEMQPKLEEPTVGIPFWPGPKTAGSEEEKARLEDYGVDSTSEGSWPIAHPPEAKPGSSQVVPEAVEPVAEEAVEADGAGPVAVAAVDEWQQDEVAPVGAELRDSGDEAVAKAKAEDESVVEDEAVTEEEAPDDEESKRLEVAKMVADLRDKVDVGAETDVEAEAFANKAPAGEDDDEARRQEVARMVAAMRDGVDLDAEDAGAEEDDESKREDVAGIVASRGTDVAGGAASHEAETVAGSGGPDAQVRDEVRRAVEAARAEMSSGYKHSEDGAEESESKFSFPDWQSTHVEPSGPPVIVIKDAEGRVELARVYETLSRVNCDENAALLNYTPHSVTVGLNARSTIPGVEDLTAAVEAVFGREADVDTDGVRLNVQIGKDLKGRNSAA